MSALAGECYSWGDAATDFAIGAAGGGLLSKLGKLGKIGKLGGSAKGVGVASGIGRSGPMQVERTIQKGEKIADIVNEAKALQYTTGKEHAIVKLASGERALVSGGEGGINMGDQVTRIFGHTHPYGQGYVGASPIDRVALQSLGQTHSYIVENGIIIRFGSKP